MHKDQRCSRKDPLEPEKSQGDSVQRRERLNERLDPSSYPALSLSHEDRNFIGNILSRRTKALHELERILRTLNVQLNGGQRLRSWASLVAVHKSNEISNGFCNL